METTAPARTLPRARRSRNRRGAANLLPDLPIARPTWLSIYTAALVVLDATAMTAATLTAKISWLGINPESFHVRSWSVPYGALALLTAPTWVALLALAGAYDVGPFGTGPRPWSQVVRAGAQLLALIAVAYYILHLEMLGRGVLVGLVPLAVALTLGERAFARFGLDGLRRRGRARRSALVVGPEEGNDRFVAQIEEHPAVGVRVVGVIELEGAATILDRTAAVAGELARTRAASVVVTGGFAQEQVRDIAWMLEGTGIALLVAPAPAGMRGVRSTMRPVAGLPLLHLDR